MFRRSLHFALPVLAKELIEQANRRRTYIVRGVYACVLFSALMLAFYTLNREAGGSPATMLGQGRWMFEIVFWSQVIAIYALLPAMLCGSITSEKERDTLVLLLLTDLRPWQILLQKLLSRIIVVLTFMLLSLPLLAVCYAYGGVSSERLAMALYILALTCLQVGAVAIMCSAFFGSTTAAFIAVYLILGLLYFTVPFVGEFRIFDIRRGAADWPTVFPPLPTLKSVAAMGYVPTVRQVLEDTASSWGAAVLALLLARRFLVRRAMRRPRNIVRIFFAAIDRFFTRLNRLVGGIVLVRDRRDVADGHPVAWMERARRAIGKPHYLVRIAIAIETPTIIVCALALGGSRGFGLHELFSVLIFLLWPVLVLWLAVQATGSFARERSQQTLEVLLSTPLQTRHIIREKTTVLWNFAAVLALPLMTVYLIEAGFEHRLGHRAYFSHSNVKHGFGTGAYLTCAALSILVYIPVVVWLSIWLGMWMKTQMRATIASILTLAGWCALPILIGFTIVVLVGHEPIWLGWVMLASPPILVAGNEFGDYFIPRSSPWPILFLHFGLHAWIALCLRRACYARADRLLGRVSGIASTSRDREGADSGTPDSFESAPSRSRLVPERP